jgi:sporulation protein YlmC with PRC-barrel domain
MKWLKTCTITISLLSLLLATGSFAAQTEKGDVKAGANIYRSSKLVGADVENAQGENLGDIKDIVIDPVTGRVAYAVLSFGGFMGLGDKYFAIPWAAFTPKAGEKEQFVLNVDKERLKNAPGFDKNNWPDMANHQWGEQVHAYYNIPPYWQPGGAGRSASTVAATVQNVDRSAKLIQLKTVNNEIVELQAPAELLSTLQTGDPVEVMIQKRGKAQ